MQHQFNYKKQKFFDFNLIFLQNFENNFWVWVTMFLTCGLPSMSILYKSNEHHWQDSILALWLAWVFMDRDNKSFWINWPKVTRRSYHHHRCLDTAHYANLTSHLYYNFIRVLTIHLNMAWHHNIKIVYRQTPTCKFLHLHVTICNTCCISLWSL